MVLSLTNLLVLFLVFVTADSVTLGDLYHPDDDVEILNINNFSKYIENSTNAWLVAFYANWCEYSQRFATPWKEFATEVVSWKDLVRVGVLECSKERNTPICTKFGIEKYPTVRYFQENYQISVKNLGAVISLGSNYSVDNNKKNIIKTIIQEIKIGRGKMYPNLLPYNQTDVSNVLTGLNNKIQFGFLISEASYNYLGAEIAMDLHKIDEIIIKDWSTDNTKLIKNLKIKKFPILVVVDRKNNTKIFTKKITTKAELKKIIIAFLKEKSVKLPRSILDIYYNKSKSS